MFFADAATGLVALGAGEPAPTIIIAARGPPIRTTFPLSNSVDVNVAWPDRSTLPEREIYFYLLASLFWLNYGACNDPAVPSSFDFAQGAPRS
jgi:hypothetical protein